MIYIRKFVLIAVLFVLAGFSLELGSRAFHVIFIHSERKAEPNIYSEILRSSKSEFFDKLSQAAFEQTKTLVIYDSSYTRLDYPNGDVASTRGVCADVVIRAYRTMNIDLQKLVHEDMQENFSVYPKIWGLTGPDSNIDHRRVPNLKTFFERHSSPLKISDNPEDYLPGDLVTWNLDSNRPHIGVVSKNTTADQKRPLVIHNIGWGVQIEDVLFEWTITGHYRFQGN